MKKKAPSCINAGWAREHLPIALGFNPESNASSAIIDLDLLAIRIKDDIELTVPILVREHESQVLVGFSPDGPTPETQEEIMVELGTRVLWAAVGGFR